MVAFKLQILGQNPRPPCLCAVKTTATLVFLLISGGDPRLLPRTLKLTWTIHGFHGFSISVNGLVSTETLTENHGFCPKRFPEFPVNIGPSFKSSSLWQSNMAGQSPSQSSMLKRHENLPMITSRRFAPSSPMIFPWKPPYLPMQRDFPWSSHRFPMDLPIKTSVELFHGKNISIPLRLLQYFGGPILGRLRMKTVKFRFDPLQQTYKKLLKMAQSKWLIYPSTMVIFHSSENVYQRVESYVGRWIGLYKLFGKMA